MTAPEGARFCASCGSAFERRLDERRTVSVLFADLVGYTTFAETRDPESVKNLVDACFERLVADVIAFGGVVDKIIGDAIVALFGAPVAHEDDPERAVRAALRMQETLSIRAETLGLDLRIRVGINTGEVLVGTLRSGGDYTAMGDVVNTASRLQVLASPGQVLVGPATHAATSSAIRYESLGLLRAKGRDEPVPAWRAIEALWPPGSRHRPSRAPLVGRDAEMGVLTHALATTRSRRRAGLLLLVGEAGAGKTRLAEELMSVARRDGALVLEGRCVPYGEVNIFAPIIEALRRAAGVLPDDTPEVSEAKSRAAVASILDQPADADDVSRLLEGIAPLMGKPGVGRAERPRASAAVDLAALGAIGEEALQPVAICLERMCVSRPLLFVIGELHWADDLLLAFLDRLLHRVADLPIVLLATARPDLFDRWSVPDGRHNRTVLYIDPLDRDASITLLGHIAHPDLTSDQRDLLVARSGGNPLWLEELAQLSQPEGAETMSAVPDSLRGLVAARLDLLDVGARAVLEDAAVCGRAGRVKTIDAMARAAGRPPIDAALDALSAAGLLTLLHGRDRWELRSDLVRDVAYGTLTKGERARRHARVAAWKSAGAGDEPRDDVLDDLAHHWATAAQLACELGEVEGLPPDTQLQAIDWVSRAARRAVQQDLWLSAGELCDTALSLTSDDDPRRAAVLLDRARARIGLHDAEGAIADLAELDRVDPDEHLRAEALVVRGELARIQGNFTESQLVLSEALSRARERGDAPVELQALRALGQTRLFSGDSEGAVSTAHDALEIARRLGDRRAEAWALQHLAWTAFTRGDLAKARMWLLESIERFTEIGDWGGRSWAEGLLAWVMCSLGDLGGAEVLGRRVLDEAGRSGDVWAKSMMRTLLANIALWTGRPEQAATEAQAAVEGLKSIDDLWGSVQARMVWGRSLIGAGHLEEGRRVLAEALSTANRLDDPAPAWTARSVQAVALALQLGDSAAALEAAPSLDEGPPAFAEELHAAIAVAHLQAGRVEEAERVIDGLLERSSSLPSAVAPWAAIVLAAAGRRGDAAGVLASVPEDKPWTFLDRAWDAVARGVVTEDEAGRRKALDEAVEIVQATGDVTAQRNVGLAASVLLDGSSTPGEGTWATMWRLAGSAVPA